MHLVKRGKIISNCTVRINYLPKKDSTFLFNQFTSVHFIYIHALVIAYDKKIYTTRFKN